MEYLVKKVNQIQILYTLTDEHLVEKVENSIRETEQFFQEEYHFKLSDLNVWLCPTIEEYIIYAEKTKEEYETWMIGCSIQEQQKIVLLSPQASKDILLDDLLKIVKHELVHFMFDANLLNCKPVEWISEGIAILLADQTDLRYVSLDDYPKLEQISLPEEFADYGGYDYAGIYVWFFIKRYGKQACLL